MSNDDPTLQNAFQDTLDKIVVIIDVISVYVRLHDELHTLTHAVFPLIVEASRQLPADKREKSNLDRYDRTLITAIDIMRDAAGRKNVALEELEWIEELDQARKQLKAVLNDFDKEKLERAIQLIQHILETKPTRINMKLWRAFKSVNDRLLELIEIMERVLSHMNEITPPPAGMPQFKVGIESLKTLTAKLDALLSEFDAWQDVTIQLPDLGELIEWDLSKFKTRWQKIRAKVAPFYVGKIDEETAVDLAIVDSQLEQALSTEHPASEKAALEGIFANYSEKATWRFYDVTSQLLKRAEYLRDIHKPLPES